MPLDTQQNIFESFTQADSSTTRKYGGTGLGTTISKQIVQLMNGKIGVHSVIDVGSTFWVQIPFEKQEEDINIEENCNFNSMHSLIVCDGECTELTKLLDGWNVRYKIVNKIKDSLPALVNSTSTDTVFNTVIVVDCESYEDIDDFPLFIHSDSRTSNTPVILMKYPSSGDSLDDYYEQGYTNVIQYPLDRSALFNAIHALGHNYNGDSIHNIFDGKVTGGDNNRPLNILVAEDNKTNQIVISKILEHAGHTSTIVNNGQEALDMLDGRGNDAFDIIILDMQMPIMGGIEATKIYRFTRIGQKTLPIIILTANATTEALRECEEAKVDSYLTKPIETRQLLTTLNSLTCDTKDVSPSAETVQTSSRDNKTKITKDDIVDLSVIDELSSLSSDNDFISPLIHGFIIDAKSLLSAMEKALSENNIESYLEHAHALKGSAGSIGALEIYNLCREALANETTRPRYLSILQRIIKAFNKTEELLLDYISEDSIQDKVNRKTV
jgi:two-component system sensor histidine kinase RpfC